MFKLISEITFIKNKSTVGDLANGLSPKLSFNFNVPEGSFFVPDIVEGGIASSISEVVVGGVINPIETGEEVGGKDINFGVALDTQGNFLGFTLNREEFIKKYESGDDVFLRINFVNNVEIESSFKNQTKTAKITLPRKMDFGGLNIITGSNPIFGRGDRVIIKLGYVYVDENSTPENIIVTNTLKEVFRGYITTVGMETPLEIECEDMMFALKQVRVMYPVAVDEKGKITLENLMKRMLLPGFNSKLTAEQSFFGFDLKANTLEERALFNTIPVILPLRIKSTALTSTAQTADEGFTYNMEREKSVSEVIADIKKKIYVYPYFDDFSNLRVELPFINSQNIGKEPRIFDFEKNIIDSSNLKFQNSEDINIKVIYKSERSNKSKKEGALYGNNLKEKFGYVGDSQGDSMTINGPDDLTQDACDAYALWILKANKYTGYAKGSTFETFGEPTVYLGESVKFISREYPEKNGTFAVIGINRSFGMGGYRQKIEVGVGIAAVIS